MRLKNSFITDFTALKALLIPLWLITQTPFYIMLFESKFIYVLVYFSGRVHTNQLLDCKWATVRLRGLFSSVVPGQMKGNPKLQKCRAAKGAFSDGYNTSVWVELLVVGLVFELWMINSERRGEHCYTRLQKFGL